MDRRHLISGSCSVLFITIGGIMLIFPDDDMLDRIVSQYVKHRDEFPVRPKAFRLHALFWEYSPEYDEVVYEPTDIDRPWSSHGGRPDVQ